jgi:hypothetical protein
LVLSPTSLINLGFRTEGRLAVVLIIPSLGVPNWSVIYINTAPSVAFLSFIAFIFFFPWEVAHVWPFNVFLSFANKSN